MSVWDRDLFARRKLAENIIKYANTVSSAGVLDEERSLVLSVDAEYGIGKTFFLKGLEEIISEDHPVAYIDAWSDDLFDEPLTALASVLRQAVEPLIRADDSLKSKWAKYAQAAGKVLKLSSKGLAVRGAQLLVTKEAVDGISSAFSISSKGDTEILDKEVEGAVEDIKSDIERQLKAIGKNDLMTERIEEFEAGVKAVADMRSSLKALVNALDGTQRKPPVFIIVDELDRCRPSYSVKILEEIKHLFAVPEVIFILGLNSDQLSKSISGIYGEKFAGRAYLDRFIDRKISLPFPDLEALCRSLLEKIDPNKRIRMPSISVEGKVIQNKERYFAELLQFYNIGPRGTFKFFDRLQTSIAVLGSFELDYLYLSECIALEIAGRVGDSGRPWSVGFRDFGQFEWVEGDAVWSRMRTIFSMHPTEASKSLTGNTPFEDYLSFGVHTGNVRPAFEYPLVLQEVADLGGE
ncbi:P-loop NTPase fold protein [Qipengyuania sp. XHP0211]|uniref:KAP family P-loop NTPase fold protein n=1 Tax=Qipengyuania sp. XHP0211 TaxID=3038079 RepID=UPI00241CDC38|nr:P-loop NTPase fold protein [Qipengyuania sp. XHP0211]MDG5750859.1 P-loop NTPase fold protein [Qipengyuania sp. XHP0211]